jgi:PPOX class probable FMN-dependent enzyme
MIEASPFAVLATAGPGGLDASPRGDAPGFVQVQDEHTLLLPERRGNNRVDSLRNILQDPRVALLFLIPGVGETLRVNGRATITTAPDVLARFTVQGQLPKCVVVVQVASVFFQCARAIQRSGLWQPAPAGVRSRVPSPGAILQALTDAAVDGEAYDRELPARQRATLY